jgi:hypothetical protein
VVWDFWVCGSAPCGAGGRGAEIGNSYQFVGNWLCGLLPDFEHVFQSSGDFCISLVYLVNGE